MVWLLQHDENDSIKYTSDHMQLQFRIKFDHQTMKMYLLGVLTNSHWKQNNSDY